MGIARIIVSLGGGRFDVLGEQRLPSLQRIVTGNFFPDPALSGSGPVSDLLAWSSEYSYWYRLTTSMGIQRVDRDELTFKLGRVQLAGNFSDRTHDDVFFLDEFQNVAFLGTTGSGDFARIVPDPFVSNVSLVRDDIAYTRVAKGRFTASRYDSLFLYGPLDHGAAIYTTDGRGIPIRVNGPLRSSRFPVLRNDYRSVLAGRFLTNGDRPDWDDILLYKAATGRGSLCTTDGFGDLQPTGLIERQPVNLGADAGEFWRAGNFTGNSLTDIATYNSNNGQLSAYVNEGGAFRRIGGMDIGAGWEIIQPGRFSSGGFTDLVVFRD
jgi:hypothetical protein